MKIAFSHDWLNGMRGGEKCLEALCELYPDGSIYTLFHEKGKVSDRIASRAIHTSRLQSFPKVFSHYRNYLPFFPAAVEAFDLTGHEVVVSTSHCVAKGIRKKKSALHVCYCFTPMRYAWALFDEYFGDRDAISKATLKYFIEKLKQWDLKTNETIDHFVAISGHVKNRIERYYHRDATVIYPPVDTDFYTPEEALRREDFYLMVSALVPYKRIDLAVEAFNRLGRELLIIGDGPQAGRLKKMAKKNVRFLNWQPDEVLRGHYRRAKALIFPGEEDFGIVPVEVQACGGFVIAFRKGGVLETVTEDKTGLFFDAPTPDSLMEAVLKFEKFSWDPEAPRKNTLRFNKQRFKVEIAEFIEQSLAHRRKNEPVREVSV